MWQLLVGTEDDWGGLILRFTLGVVMLPHGGQKVFGWFGGNGWQMTVEGFARMGLPEAVAILVILAESLGAALLLLGFLTRLCALGIGLVMGGAIALAHWPHGFFMNWYGQQAGEGFEYHLLAIGIALALLVRGGGFASVDLLLTRQD